MTVINDLMPSIYNYRRIRLARDLRDAVVPELLRQEVNFANPVNDAREEPDTRSLILPKRNLPYLWSLLRKHIVMPDFEAKVYRGKDEDREVIGKFNPELWIRSMSFSALRDWASCGLSTRAIATSSAVVWMSSFLPEFADLLAHTAVIDIEPQQVVDCVAATRKCAIAMVRIELERCGSDLTVSAAV